MLQLTQPTAANYRGLFKIPWQEKVVYLAMSGFLLAAYILFLPLFWTTHQLLFLEIAISPFLATFTYAVSDEAACRAIRLTLFCVIVVCVFEAVAVVSMMAI